MMKRLMMTSVMLIIAIIIPLSTHAQTTTDFEITLTDGSTVIVSAGDKIKFAKLVASEPSVKHTNLPQSMYSINLDNGQFDNSGVLSFTEISGSNQEIMLDHSEFRYNLVVSVEWDATVEYLSGVERAFRNLSNYLYDVTDGQARLDTVMIYDDQDHWLDADVRIWANNSFRPFAAIGGVHHNALGDVVNMPRKWFGSIDNSRNGTYDEPQPLDYNYPDNYRTLAHELGHYLFGFEEEYEFTDGNGQCFSVPNYGFMDHPYENSGIYASEMSNNTMYAFTDCRNTKQYNSYGVSCWDMFEIDFEKQYGIDNIFVPVKRPDPMDISENITPSGYNYIPGPNDNLASLNYDVGALIQFPQSHNMPGGFTIEVITHDFQDNRLGSIDVTLRNPSLGGGWVDIKQGQSSDVLPGGALGGGIYVLGAESGAMIQASSQYTMMGSPSPPHAFRSTSSSFNWLVGEVTVTGPTDTVSLTLSPIEGNYPLVLRPSLSNNTVTLALDYETPFNTVPTLELSGSSQTYSFQQSGNSYTTSIVDSMKSGTMTILAKDASGTPYFFRSPYVTYKSDSGLVGQLLSSNGEFALNLDTAGIAPRSAMITVSPYPVPLNGLNSFALHVGNTFGLSLDAIASGAHALTIRYSSSDINPGVNLNVNESSLAVYSWNNTIQSWEILGGVVDTLAHLIQVTLPGSGAYALFTTEAPVSCCLGSTGNVDCDPNSIVDITDLTVLISHLFIDLQPLCCKGAGNIDGDPAGTVDITDLATLIDHLFIGLKPTAVCQ